MQENRQQDQFNIKRYGLEWNGLCVILISEQAIKPFYLNILFNVKNNHILRPLDFNSLDS